jgi:transcriptional regulator with XRE-family HTH domain
MAAGLQFEEFAKVDTLVGARVRALREGRKMSQTTLGVAIGVSFQQIQKYERGSNRIAASTLFHIAQVLGVSPGDFFDGMQASNAGAADWSKLADPQMRALLESFAKLASPKIKARIVELVESLAAES